MDVYPLTFGVETADGILTDIIPCKTAYVLLVPNHSILVLTDNSMQHPRQPVPDVLNNHHHPSECALT